MKTKKIAIATPTTTMVNFQFAQSLAAAVGHISSKGYNVDLLFNSGSVLHRQRNNLVRSFLNSKNASEYTHLIWIDSDMQFPPNSFEDLINHKKDIVGVNYCARQGAPRFTAATGSERVATTSESTGLQEVDILGLGLVCVTKEALEKIGYPWFDFITISDSIMGEDEYFFGKARSSGFDVWLDHDLSKHVYHIGQTLLDYNYPNLYQAHQEELKNSKK